MLVARFEDIIRQKTLVAKIPQHLGCATKKMQMGF